MSTWAVRLVRCPCGHEFEMQVADGLHISRLPAVRAKILDGTFHRASCPRCSVLRTIEKKLLYTDFARMHWIGVCPSASTPSWSVLEQSLVAEFRRIVTRAAPPAIRALGQRFVVRLVFGYDQLAEKLALLDAGLDDRIVELVKLRVLERHRALVRPGMQVRALPSGERLELDVRYRGSDEAARTGCDMRLYEKLAREREDWRPKVPGLIDGAFVHLDRLIFPPLETPEAIRAAEQWSAIAALREPPLQGPGGSPGAELMAPSTPSEPRPGEEV